MTKVGGGVPGASPRNLWSALSLSTINDMLSKPLSEEEVRFNQVKHLQRGLDCTSGLGMDDPLTIFYTTAFISNTNYCVWYPEPREHPTVSSRQQHPPSSCIACLSGFTFPRSWASVEFIQLMPARVLPFVGTSVIWSPRKCSLVT